MIPLTRSAFWGPMAYTILGGLFVATFLTLLFLPALYALWFRGRVKAEERVQVSAEDRGEAEGLVTELKRLCTKRSRTCSASQPAPSCGNTGHTTESRILSNCSAKYQGQADSDIVNSATASPRYREFTVG